MTANSAIHRPTASPKKMRTTSANGAVDFASSSAGIRICTALEAMM